MRKLSPESPGPAGREELVRMKERCPWPGDDPQMVAYHDEEWGVPLHDNRKLFEFLVLDAFQAGLSWAIVLRKREAFRKAFAGFDPARVARFTSARVERLLADPGIVRNRQKVESTVSNARAFLAVQREFGSFDRYIWQFTDGRTKLNRCRTLRQIPCRSAESDASRASSRAVSAGLSCPSKYVESRSTS